MGWVLDHYPISTAASVTRKKILLAVANGADQFGRGSRRSCDTIADQWAMNSRAVRRILNDLVHEGSLAKRASSGRVPAAYDVVGFIASLTAPAAQAELDFERNPRQITAQPAPDDELTRARSRKKGESGAANGSNEKQRLQPGARYSQSEVMAALARVEEEEELRRRSR
jgi:hypothetical protein